MRLINKWITKDDRNGVTSLNKEISAAIGRFCLLIKSKQKVDNDSDAGTSINECTEFLSQDKTSPCKYRPQIIIPDYYKIFFYQALSESN